MVEKELKLGEPVKDRITDFRATGFVLVLKDGDVCIEGFKVCLLALLGLDCQIEVFAYGASDWAGQARPDQPRSSFFISRSLATGSARVIYVLRLPLASRKRTFRQLYKQISAEVL
jgi:hypothetical protein